MSESIEPIIQSELKKLLDNVDANAALVLSGTPEGFELTLFSNENTYKLVTQRNTPRLFKSPNTVIKFVAEMGSDIIRIDGLQNWYADSYVTKTSRSKQAVPAKKTKAKKTTAKKLKG